MNKQILKLAIPSIVSNITVPLLGLVDLAIVGHLGSTAYIGAIAIGTMMFNIIYWAFGFLRMGTGGLVAQAYGKQNREEIGKLLIRSLSVAFGIALFLLLFQYPIQWVTFHLVESSTEVAIYAQIYFRICIWGAPATLGLYCFAGWFIGMQNARIPMFIAISQNIINIIGSLCFVYLFHWGIQGVAAATLTAQYSGILLAIFFWRRKYSNLQQFIRIKKSFSSPDMKQFFSVNSDIFFRTLCLITVTTFFTVTGARQGDLILAVNTLLMQLFTLFSYFMDGFAYAGEAMSGRFIGSKDRPALQKTIRALFCWGGMLALFFTLLYGFGGKAILHLLTNDKNVVDTSGTYYFWVLAIPFAGFAAFLWDGIYIGTTHTRKMLYTMIIAAVLFFAVYYSLTKSIGNHALWAAFIVYLFSRGVLQSFWSRFFLKENR
ncbi:MAG: MATE family efflux transporter [Massilibacteroides sp.]|nr:MATE family efflux transporter [Massilibacteroides sp.]MDD3063395.1 MATE family efflux transporter [Massilibacteroides sp.]MDD4115284.1 MATE family efflux transporter [Massilibacteroides sp.]MDD4661150.1 MATE family efflux transporter [Massilibacteroides sp.]